MLHFPGLHFLALWLLVRVAGRLPAAALYLGADIAGTLGWYASAAVRATTRDHMRHVLSRGAEGAPSASEVDRAARGAVRSAARYYADFARTAHLAPGEAFAEVESFDGINHYFEASDRGCGVILFSAHVGSPEYIFRSASYLGLDMVVLTEVLSPPRVHDFMHAARAVPGVQFVPADGAGLRTVLATLRAGGTVAILGDRDIQGSGKPVLFFGERAALPSGPVQLALRTHAALIPVAGRRLGPARFSVTMGAPLELPRSGEREADQAAGMRIFARALEQIIAEAPEQWFALHPVWSGLGAGREQPEGGTAGVQ
ncbi:MAG: lysophospholipid acyltransferase family protein [Dehalococcoidia bacterium]